MSIKFKDLEEGDKFKTRYIDHNYGELFKKEKRQIRCGFAHNAWKNTGELTWEDGHFFADSDEVIKV